MDYDVVIDFYGKDSEEAKLLGYDNMDTNFSNTDRKTDLKNLHKKFGIYAYLGRIPSSHIDYVLFDYKTFSQHKYDIYEKGSITEEYYENVQSVTKWKKYTVDEFKKFVNRNLEFLF